MPAIGHVLPPKDDAYSATGAPVENAALVAVVQGVQQLLKHPPGHILLRDSNGSGSSAQALTQQASILSV